MIEARNLRVNVGAKLLLDDVSLRVAAGEVVAIVGANGAGKSTLLRALDGNLKPARGGISLNGCELTRLNARRQARLRAVLPQASTLAFPFTALEVALMGRTPHLAGSESKRDYDIARHALEAVDTLHLAARTYTTLSGGERQRVQLARVLTQIWEETPDELSARGRYLLLDEPTSSLDLAHAHQTLAVARNFARCNIGVLMVLHDLNLAAQYADRIVALKDGRVLAEGTPRAVLVPETIQTAFGIDVCVMPHPRLACPLVVPLAQGDLKCVRLNQDLRDWDSDKKNLNHEIPRKGHETLVVLLRVRFV